jgi:hypothetical protein
MAADATSGGLKGAFSGEGHRQLGAGGWLVRPLSDAVDSDALSAPKVDSSGELKCGFDILLGDRGHLEFTMAHTGWGRSFVKTEQPKEKGKGPGRGR